MPTELSNTKWIKATAIGWLSGIILVLLLAMVFEGMGIHSMQFFMGIGMGAGVGFMQWHVLRKILAINKNWILAAVTGMSVPFLLFDLLQIFAGVKLGPDYILYSVSIAALLTGILQSLILKKFTPAANLWVAANIMGWIAATLTFLSINYTKQVFSNNLVIFFVNIAVMLAGGFVFGFITWMFLKKILPIQKQ